MEIASDSDMSGSEDIDNENLSEENNEDEDNVAIDSDEEVFQHIIYQYYLDCNKSYCYFHMSNIKIIYDFSYKKHLQQVY